MQGHVIVCGLQVVGLRRRGAVSLSVKEGVVIDDDADPRFSRTLGDWGIPTSGAMHRGEGSRKPAPLRGAAVICVEVDEIHTLETALRIKEIRRDQGLVVQLANPLVAQDLERVVARAPAGARDDGPRDHHRPGRGRNQRCAWPTHRGRVRRCK